MMYLVMFVGVLAMIGGASYATWDVTSGYYRMKEDRAVAQAVAVEAQRRADLAVQLAAAERKAAEVREIEVVKWKTIKKEVERVVASDPVYVRLECRVTPDGVRVYNAAANGLQLAAAAGEAAVVPSQPATAEGGSAVGRPPVDGGSSRRPVPRVPAGT
jgi:hypothetical protein